VSGEGITGKKKAKGKGFLIYFGDNESLNTSSWKKKVKSKLANVEKAFPSFCHKFKANL